MRLALRALSERCSVVPMFSLLLARMSILLGTVLRLASVYIKSRDWYGELLLRSRVALKQVTQIGRSTGLRQERTHSVQRGVWPMPRNCNYRDSVDLRIFILQREILLAAQNRHIQIEKNYARGR